MENRKRDRFYEEFAKEYLRFFGNENPTENQLETMHVLLLQVWGQKSLCLDNRLNYREGQCLQLSALGNSIKEIASFLNVSTRQVERHRNAIFQKLDCKNITQSVAHGLRFGYIKPPEDSFFECGKD